MKRILVLDGGGCKGLVQLSVLCSIANELKKEAADEFDLIIGSSVGAVEGGLLSTGLISALTFKDLMYNNLPNIFKKRLRIPVLQPIYSRKPLTNLLDLYVIGTKMNHCKTRFICTSCSLVDGRTHFFKSWEKKDGELELTQVILRSAAAPLYFGTLIDEETHNVWMDGGCGNMNAPIMEAFIETMRQSWLLNEHVHILSIGCGQSDQGVPFEKAKKFKNIRQVNSFLKLPEGGMSRTQMARAQEDWITSICRYNFDLTFQRVEMYGIPKKIDKLDGVKYRDQYLRIGEELAKEVDYTYLK